MPHISNNNQSNDNILYILIYLFIIMCLCLSAHKFKILLSNFLKNKNKKNDEILLHRCSYFSNV